MKNLYKILVGKREGKRPSEELHEDGNLILEWILGYYGGKLWTGCTMFRIGASGGLL
jgi:hypothetical protein